MTDYHYTRLYRFIAKVEDRFLPTVLLMPTVVWFIPVIRVQAIKAISNSQVLEALLITVHLLAGFATSQFISILFGSNNRIVTFFASNKNLAPKYLRFFREHIFIALAAIFTIILAMVNESNVCIKYCVFTLSAANILLPLRLYFVATTLFNENLEKCRQEIADEAKRKEHETIKARKEAIHRK
jgi:hypothetical protein